MFDRVSPVNKLPTICFDRNVPVVILNKDDTIYNDYVSVAIGDVACGQVMAQLLS